MNKKTKNKKGNKTTSVQNEEVKLEDRLEDKIVENVREERVPEIVSEVPPAEEIKDDAPKKPKRNRGKKKKGYDDDFGDHIGEATKQEAVEEIKTVIAEDVEEKSLNIATVIPTVRKKKNKKKNNEQIEELTPNKDVQAIFTDSKAEPVLMIEEQEEVPKIEPEEREVKPSKKKNKKKKRDDSEKSDKEEVLSCTTAFQQLLEVKKEPVEQTGEANMNEPPLADIPLKPETKNVEKPTSTAPQPTVDIISNDEKDLTEEPKAENKSMKKNKKDKKHAKDEEPYQELQDSKKDDQMMKPTTVKGTVDITLEDTKDITTIEPLESQTNESSPKLKANIAKPVEKKRKGKDRKPDKSYETIPEPIKSEETELSKETCESKDMKEQSMIEVLNILDIPLTSEENKTDKRSQIQELSIPDSLMGKKREKTPHIEQVEMSSEGVNQASRVEYEAKSIDLDKERIPLQNELLIFEGRGQISDQPQQLPPEPFKVDTIKLGADMEIKQDTMLLTEATESKDTIQIEKGTKQKSGKKRKKSPKRPIKAEETKNKDLGKESYTSESIKDQHTEHLDEKEVKEQISKEKVEASTEIPKLDDIEIRSVKTDESEGSACEVTPDVLYPRSASQQQLDNNNNMVIREILPSENILLDAPIVLGFVDIPKTPEPTPEKNILEVKPASCSKIPEPSYADKTVKLQVKEEKTDLKSKMMEVNQDMEELRLSIEKSLAEFTAIEKKEEEVEKQFDESKLEAKDATPLLTADPVQQVTVEMSTETTVACKPKEMILETPEESTKTIEDDFKNNIHQTTEPVSGTQTTYIKTFDQPQIDKIIESASLSKTIELEPSKASDIKSDDIPVPAPPTENLTPTPLLEVKIPETQETEKTDVEIINQEHTPVDTPPVCPARKDHKGKHKKKKGKQDTQTSTPATTSSSTTTTETKDTKDAKKDKKTESKTENKEKGKQQADSEDTAEIDYEPIEHFEDALTSSVDDVNKTFEMIVNEGKEQTTPKINIIAPDEDKKTKVEPSKNLLGHPDIPVQSNKRNYKKEKHKIPNESQAKVKIKDCVDIEKSSKNTQTVNKIVRNCKNEVTLNVNEEFVYKYSFRKVFLQCSCHVCKKEIVQRVPCGYCNLVFYCSVKHKDEDWSQHQALCFAVSTIVHLKDQKHIYSDIQNITGQDYRLVRMQMIVSCEKVLKRRLVPWEQEALLYPRVCATTSCREWRQSKLKDCEGCRQISYCAQNPDHLPKTHQRWCKSYSLYQKLVCYQQTKGRLEPKLPSKVMQEQYEIPEKINEVLASIYEEKIDMNDIQYAALTQIATAPLTAAYCHQYYRNKMNIPANGFSKKSSFTIHVVGAELQFEADALSKWEVFVLHLRPDLQELRVVLINYHLNPSNLPLDLLGKIKLCDNCRQNKRRVVFSFQNQTTYPEYRSSDNFVHPDLICAFNPSIQRSSIYNGKDPWPTAINTIIKLKTPLLVTGYTMTELRRDCMRIKECAELPYNVVSEPQYNTFASVRPDRNFISDDEIPLLFKNYCYTILCG